jgi:uncharacterized SAM-binding protein YcdF (DUF218 family)
MVLRRGLAVGVALAAVVALAAALLVPAAGRYLVAEDPPERADAIVVLAGSYPDRVLEAVELYKLGLAPRIILCREPETSGFRRVAELGLNVPRPSDISRLVAEQLGVPPQAIEVLSRAGDSTYAEAQTVIDEAARRGYRAILLVTSKYHTRRAAAIYRLLAGGRVKVIVRAARHDDFQSDRWWRHRMSARRLIIEYQKLLNFQLLDRWRLSPATPTTVAR